VISHGVPGPGRACVGVQRQGRLGVAATCQGRAGEGEAAQGEVWHGRLGGVRRGTRGQMRQGRPGLARMHAARRALAVPGFVWNGQANSWQACHGEAWRGFVRLGLLRQGRQGGDCSGKYVKERLGRLGWVGHGRVEQGSPRRGLARQAEQGLEGPGKGRHDAPRQGRRGLACLSTLRRAEAAHGRHG